MFVEITGIYIFPDFQIMVFWRVTPCSLVDTYQTTWGHTANETNFGLKFVFSRVLIKSSSRCIQTKGFYILFFFLK
jgi:hypothetical protein